MLAPFSAVPSVGHRPVLRRSLSLVMLLMLLASLLPGLSRQPDLAPVDLAAPVTPATSPLPPLTANASALPAGASQRLPYPLPAALAGKPELTDLRTSNSATFALDNGQYALLQTSDALHYQDSQGTWQPINPAFEAVDDGWVNTTNVVQTSLSHHSSNAKVGTPTIGIGWQPQALTLVADARQPQVLATPLADPQASPGIRSQDSSMVRYAHSWDNADVQDQWQSRPGSSEYTMRLLALPAAGPLARRFSPVGTSLDLRVHLHLRPGTRIEVNGKPIRLPLETSDPLLFVGASNDVLLLQPPTTYEQHNPDVQVQGSYALVATTDPSVVELRVRTPWSWLAARERQFPVIIDPIFQVRSPTSVLNSIHNKASGAFISYIDRAPDAQLELGPDGTDARRILVRFNRPSLPAGSTIVRAVMDMLPSRADTGNDYNTLAQGIQAFPLTNNVWDSFFPTRPAPDFNPAAPLPNTFDGSGSNGLLWASTGGAVGPVWDLTAQVQSWFTGGTNNGIIIRAENENCKRGAMVFNCGRVYVNAPSTWTDDDLAGDETIFRLADTILSVSSQGHGGIRLLVVYDGPVLSEGQTVDRTGLVFFGPPNNPSTNPPYYHADHDYRLNPLPGDHWQALVLRSPGELIGPNPPTEANRAPLIQRWADTLPLRVYNSSGSSKQSEILSADDQVSYILLDGRSNPGAQLRAQVGATGNPQPNGYQLSLQGESTPIASTLDAPGTVVQYQFDTDTRLALHNLVMPGGSNSRVDIEFYGINLFSGRDFTGQPYEPDYQRFYDAYVKDIDFRAFLYKSGGPAAKNSTTLGIERSMLARATLPDADISRLSSSGITPAAGDNYALALEYHGLRTDLYTCVSAGGGEFPSCLRSDVQRLKVSVRIRVTSCSPGSFPTARGTCQQVVCPSVTSESRDVAGMGLWSQSGWTDPNANAPAATANEGAAPMIGGINRAVPTVAVIDGSVSYNRATNSVSLGATSEVKLVNCGSLTTPNNPLTNEDTLDVFIGAMNSGVVGGDSVLLPVNATNARESFLYQAWSTNDLKDLSNPSLFINPTAGTANGAARLVRRVPNDQGVTTALSFDPVWSLNVTGWNSLASSVTPVGGNPAPPTIASLLLDLGPALQLDLQPSCPSGKCPRLITAIRAPQAIISQLPALGGDTQSVQAVILQRGVPVPLDQPKPCPNASCIDLRGPNDVANMDPPNRNWTMPNVHTNVQAGTVLLQRQGEVLAYSTDHPYASTQAVDQQFSFDAFNARVSIQTEPCEPGGAEVTVIRGETNMTLPNIGSGEASIKATFKLCETSLRGVSMSFSSSVGIPIGNSGLFLTGLSGKVDIYADYTQVNFGLDFQAAQGGDGGIFKGHGDVTIDTRGLFAFQGTAKILGVVNADGKLWAAWNPLDIGFEVNVRLGDWLRGFARAHMWKGQGWQHRYTWLPDNDETHIAAQIGATITIKKGAAFSWWFIDIPPDDIDLGIELAFGQFCTNGSCTSYEWGVKGKLTILGYDIGLYYGFDEGLDFILGNDGHVLIDQYGGAQTSPILQASSLSGQLRAPPSPFAVRAAMPAVDGVSTEVFTVSTQAENLLFALGWQSGAPQLSLVRPDGEEITPANAVTFGATFSTTTHSILVGVQDPQSGPWQAKISNLTGQEHYKFVYLSNKGEPGTLTNRGRFLTPAQANEPGTGSYTLTWDVPADAPISSTISLYSRITVPISLEVQPGEQPATRVQNLPIVQNLPFRAGRYVWDTSFLASGSYQVYAVVDDGINDFPAGQVSNPDDTCTAFRAELPPNRAFDANRFPGTSIFTATGTVRVSDTIPPAVPTGLAALGGDDTILARWNASLEHDIAAYLIEWGSSSGGTNFSRLGAERITAVETPTLHIRSLPAISTSAYAVRVSAIDASGNTSTPSAAQPVPIAALANTLPRAPQAFTVTNVTSNSASFTWTADPSGTPPTSYRLTYIRFGGAADSGQVNTTSPSATLNNLPTGAVYRVTVQAAVGPYWFSPASEPVTVTVSSGIDSNGDSLPDDWTQAYGISNALSDPDGDGLINRREFEAGSNPNIQDTDSDGFSDTEEVEGGTSPVDSVRYPVQFTQPRLALETDRLVFRPLLEDPTSAPAQSVAWSNVASGTLQLSASSSEPWLAASVISNTVRVSVNPNGLNPGYYAGVVRLTRTRGSDPLIGPPACIRVESWVSSEVIGVQSVALAGATQGTLSTTYTFTATTSPLVATQPITYLWEATGQTPVIRTGAVTDTVNYTWDTAGPKTIRVRASNRGYTTETEHVIAVGAPISETVIGVQSVMLTGDRQGILSTTYTFTATTSPLTATQPITYLWEATGQSPVTHTGSVTDTIMYTWDTEGSKTIRVWASNRGYTTQTVHLIAIGTRVGETRIYLPLLRR